MLWGGVIALSICFISIRPVTSIPLSLSRALPATRSRFYGIPLPKSSAIVWNLSNFGVDPFDRAARKIYHCALMSNRLPDYIDPARFADTGNALAGTVPFSRMQRLTDIAGNPVGVADVELQFDVDAQGTRIVQGRVRAEVELVCQRCLQPMSWAVDAEVHLGIVTSESEAEQLASVYDPLLIGEDPLPLAELVEDEILLALPVFPRHEAGECVAAVGNTQEGTARQSDKPNPFAVLARLKPN